MLEQLTQELKIEMPKQKQKSFFVAILPNLSILFHELESGFALHSSVAMCPIEKREERFILFMQANFLGQGTGGARIGLEADEKVLTLASGFPYEMNYPHFKESVEDFVNFVVFWRDKIAQLEQEK